MLTWSDHYANDQLKAVSKASGLKGRPTLFSDNADAYLKIKQTGRQFDIVSGDALWVPKYHKDGLTDVLRPLVAGPPRSSSTRSPGTFPFWQDGSTTWAIRSRGRPCRSTTTRNTSRRSQTSWHALLDKKYAGKISLENIPTDMMAIAGPGDGREAALLDVDGGDLEGEGTS